MRREKRVILLDPIKDPIITQVFNDIVTLPYYKMEYKEKNKKLWQKVSSKFSNEPKCKILIKEDFVEPPVTSRYQEIGMIVKKPNIDVIKQQMGKKIKFTLTRKIF